jgi:hypothetical protein
MFDTNPTETEVLNLMTVLSETGHYTADELNQLETVFRYTDWPNFGKSGQMAKVPPYLMLRYTKGMMLFAALVKQLT